MTAIKLKGYSLGLSRAKEIEQTKNKTKLEYQEDLQGTEVEIIEPDVK